MRNRTGTFGTMIFALTRLHVFVAPQNPGGRSWRYFSRAHKYYCPYCLTLADENLGYCPYCIHGNLRQTAAGR